MTLAAGTRFGVFEIRSALGAGGMGEVYRARDTRLERDVAIKILPGVFAADPDRLMRFEREAKTLAALNHPHIAQIHGVEEAGATRALVMELVEGEDLAVRLARGPIPIDEARPIARQIAEALEAAHEAGIVHRDLKPANVKLRPDGTVKVLDFGLAKALDPLRTSDPQAAMHSPTFTSPALTEMGVILGTAAYMAPEQAKGRVVDRRADIWAFGCLLYEMLVGRSPFAGESVAETLGYIVTRDVDLAALPADVPPEIRWLLARCFEREPRRRLRDIGEARVLIESGAAPVSAAPAAPAGRARWLAPVLVVAAVALAALAGSWLAQPSPVVVDPQQFAIALPPHQEVMAAGNALLAFAPDGGAVVFSGLDRGRQTLMRRRLGDREAEPIPGTEEGAGVFFSPDGRWIGFSSRSRLLKVQAEGGRPVPLAESSGTGGGAWLRDNTIIYAPAYSDGLFRVSADGGTAERLTTPNREDGELGHWWPEALPGDRYVLFTAFRSPADRSRVGVLDLVTRDVRWVVEGGFFGRYAPSGHLLYARERRLFAMPFDAAAARPSGRAVEVLDDLYTATTGGYGSFAVSHQGTLVYVAHSVANSPRELTWFDRTGRATPATAERRSYGSVSLAPDGRRAAVTITQDSWDIWTLALDRGTLSRLTTGLATEFDPRWTRDGRELLYVLDRPPHEFQRIGAGSPDSGRPLWPEPADVDHLRIAVSPDGQLIAYQRADPGQARNIYVRPLDGRAPPRAVRATRSDEAAPSFSPDGRWIAYHSDETDRAEIYAEPLDDPDARVQVTSDGGHDPIWTAAGEIVFRRGDEVRVAAAVTGARPVFGEPRTLFRARVLVDPDSQVFDVTADGTRFLAVTIPDEGRPRQLQVVTGWAAALAKQVR
jgi:eukaryotic-like serine/threonine-protein kinase